MDRVVTGGTICGEMRKGRGCIVKLDSEQVAKRLEQIPEWGLDEKTIVRRFKFASFPLAMKFVGQVAELAEERNHHPFISIDYRVVTLKLTSWHAGGLTDDDFAEAMTCDEIYQTFA